MNRLLVIPSLSFCLFVLPAHAEGDKVPAVRPTNIVKRPTHKDIVKTQQEQKRAKHKKNTSRALTKKPLVKIKKRSIIGSATLLGSGEHWTLVPRGSVVYIPPRLKAKIITKPMGSLIGWKRYK